MSRDLYLFTLFCICSLFALNVLVFCSLTPCYLPLYSASTFTPSVSPYSSLSVYFGPSEGAGRVSVGQPVLPASLYAFLSFCLTLLNLDLKTFESRIFWKNFNITENYKELFIGFLSIFSCDKSVVLGVIQFTTIVMWVLLLDCIYCLFSWLTGTKTKQRSYMLVSMVTLHFPESSKN